MSSDRPDKVGREISLIIAEMVGNGRIKDPRVDKLLSISGVQVSRDLGSAVVRVGGFLGDSDLEQTVEGLQSAAGVIQAEINKRLHIRLTPRLRFVADHSIREGFQITEKLKELVPKSGEANGAAVDSDNDASGDATSSSEPGGESNR